MPFFRHVPEPMRRVVFWGGHWTFSWPIRYWALASAVLLSILKTIFWEALLERLSVRWGISFPMFFLNWGWLVFSFSWHLLELFFLKFLKLHKPQNYMTIQLWPLHG